MKKLLKLIGKYKIFLAFSVIFAAISVVLQLYVPVLFGDAIDEVVSAHQVNFDMMWYYLKQILIFIVISAFATWFMNLLNNRMTYRIVQDIRSQAIRHIQVLPLSYLDQHSTGDIVSRVIADTDILSDGLLLGFTQLFSGIVTIVVTLIFMFSKNVWVTLLVIVLTPFSFVVAKFISSRSYTMFRKQSETRGRQTALIEEMIGGQKVVKAFGYEKESSRRFDEINKELQNYSQKAVFYSSLTNPSTRFVNNIIYAGVALLGAFLIPGGTLTVGGLSVLLAYANQYMKPFNDISSVVTEMQNALACADRIFDLLEQKEETLDAEGAFATVDGNVTIDDVAFSYDKEKELIENFNLDVKPGMRIAIVGPTGAGKTTMIKLLLGYYPLLAGEITIGSTDLQKYNLKWGRKHCGVVMQDGVIFSESIARNIAVDDGEIDKERLLQAARIACIDNYIQTLPLKYNTLIGQDGIGLSQGQKQRILIARAVYKNPDYIFLDEATNALDANNERAIVENLMEFYKGKTVVIVAHRLSTVKNADQLIVIERGKIIETGTHTELIDRQGAYYHLVKNQLELGS